MKIEDCQITNEGVNGIKGFKYAGICSGIKKSGREDIALLFSEVPAVAAGVFTTNKMKAAPVLVDQENIKNPVTRAVIINSGLANACTGRKGMDNALKMARLTAGLLGVGRREVLVSSTGLIGIQLPMKKIEAGIKKAVESLDACGGDAAARGIMTTDTRQKKISIDVNLEGGKTRVGAIAKGAGMIHPNMATMLCYILTDAAVEKALLQDILEDTVQDTFNMISVDGDTSTNDTVIALANGMAGNRKISQKNADYHRLLKAFKTAAAAMAKEIVMDGEGATKFLQVRVLNALTAVDARVGAKAVVSSTLVKAAFFAEDANWGRILCALGYSGANFDPCKVEMHISSPTGALKLVDKGEGLSFEREKASSILAEREIEIAIDLHQGEYQATAWGCGLAYDYMRISGS